MNFSGLPILGQIAGGVAFVPLMNFVGIEVHQNADSNRATKFVAFIGDQIARYPNRRHTSVRMRWVKAATPEERNE